MVTLTYHTFWRAAGGVLLISSMLPLALSFLGYSLGPATLSLLGPTTAAWAGALLNWQAALLSLGVGILVGLVTISITYFCVKLTDNVTHSMCSSTAHFYFSDKAWMKKLPKIEKDPGFTIIKLHCWQSPFDNHPTGRIVTLASLRNANGALDESAFRSLNKQLANYSVVDVICRVENEVELDIDGQSYLHAINRYKDLKHALSKHHIKKHAYAQYHYKICKVNPGSDLREGKTLREGKLINIKHDMGDSCHFGYDEPVKFLVRSL